MAGYYGRATDLKRQVAYNRTLAKKTIKNAEERAQAFLDKADRIQAELDSLEENTAQAPESVL